MKRKVVPVKNYILLGLLALVTVIGVFYLAKWYRTNKEYQINNTLMKGVISEVKSEELENYLSENPNILIYFTSSSNQDIKGFEKSLKKKISKEDLTKEIVYLDLDTIQDTNFYATFKKNYFDENLKAKNVELLSIPNLLIIRDGEVIDILYKRNMQINMSDVTQFLEIYEMVDAE